MAKVDFYPKYGTPEVFAGSAVTLLPCCFERLPGGFCGACLIAALQIITIGLDQIVYSKAFLNWLKPLLLPPALGLPFFAAARVKKSKRSQTGTAVQSAKGKLQ